MSGLSVQNHVCAFARVGYQGSFNYFTLGSHPCSGALYMLMVTLCWGEGCDQCSGTYPVFLQKDELRETARMRLSSLLIVKEISH